MAEDVDYVDLGAEWLIRRTSSEHQLARLVRRIQKLGAEVEVTMPPASAKPLGVPAGRSTLQPTLDYHEGAAVVSKYEFIDSRKNEPVNTNPVSKVCRWQAASTSGFSHRAKRPQSATAARGQSLTAERRHLFDASDGTYEYRRIHADLADEGTECTAELVREIMRKEGLAACQPRPFRVTTEADPEAATGMPDLLKRDLTADRPR